MYCDSTPVVLGDARVFRPTSRLCCSLPVRTFSTEETNTKPLKEWREARGLSQRKLAENAGGCVAPHPLRDKFTPCAFRSR